MYTRFSTVQLALLLVTSVGGALVAGTVLGRRRRHGSHDGSDGPEGVLQAALLGLVGLLLAFGLSMAVDRFENRREIVVREANALGTTYLRAQLLDEPARSVSLALLQRYAGVAVALAGVPPRSATFEANAAELAALQQDLWAAAGPAVRDRPVDTAPRLYVDALNGLIDAHTDRVASLRNGVPGSVVAVEILAAALGVGVLAFHLAASGRSAVSAPLVAGLIIVILFVTFDLDRPRRGFIHVPDAPLRDVQASMATGPGAAGS